MKYAIAADTFAFDALSAPGPPFPRPSTLWSFGFQNVDFAYLGAGPHLVYRQVLQQVLNPHPGQVVWVVGEGALVGGKICWGGGGGGVGFGRERTGGGRGGTAFDAVDPVVVIDAAVAPS